MVLACFRKAVHVRSASFGCCDRAICPHDHGLFVPTMSYDTSSCATQASTNTVLAHFASIVFANWLLRILNRAAAKAAA